MVFAGREPEGQGEIIGHAFATKFGDCGEIVLAIRAMQLTAQGFAGGIHFLNGRGTELERFRERKRGFVKLGFFPLLPYKPAANHGWMQGFHVNGAACNVHPGCAQSFAETDDNIEGHFHAGYAVDQPVHGVVDVGQINSIPIVSGQADFLGF